MAKLTMYGFDAEVKDGDIMIYQALDAEENGSQIKLSLAEAKCLCMWILENTEKTSKAV